MGKCTASELHNILTPEFAQRKGETVRTYLASKVAEMWRGEPLPAFTSFATEQGQLMEEQIKPWYEFEYDCEIQNVPFITGDDGRCGASPDGLLGSDNGLEIKAPQAVNHVKYLLDGEVPKDYLAQIHGSMFVTGRPRWTFVSYSRRFPALVLTVKRDEAIMEKIQKSLTAFYQQFDEAMARLNALNAA